MFSLLLPLNYLPLFLSVLNTVLVLPHFEIYEKSRFSFFFHVLKHSLSRTFPMVPLRFKIADVDCKKCHIVPFYVNRNLTLGLFTAARIVPRANFDLPSFKTVFYLIQKARNWKSNIHAFLAISVIL